MNKPPRIGKTFESSLRDEGIHCEEVYTAIKHALALQIERGMAAQYISKTAMAGRMKTSLT